jgi:NAD(P)H-dependent flavin oxidoreductase YrpB (nitropropane dioxygenase family)
MTKIKKLVIGDLAARIPLVQGGMGVGISLSGLASAVANQGGIGVIAAAGIGRLEPDFFTNFTAANVRALKKEIKKARQSTKGILGVNIMAAFSNFKEMVEASVDQKIDIIFSGAGLPLSLPQFLRTNAKTKLVPIVSSARAFRIICKSWLGKFNRFPDAVVVEGPKAGGHLGFKAEKLNDPANSLEILVPSVIRETNLIEDQTGRHIPVIPGGGIYTGGDVRRFLDMGASGVQIATRFVTTEECDSSPAFKQTYIDAKKEDIVIIKSPVGMPGRVIRNQFIREMEMGKRRPFKCPYRCIKTCNYLQSPFCIALALINAQRGRLRSGFAFAGTNAYRATKIISVKELMDEILEEYETSGKNISF